MDWNAPHEWQDQELVTADLLNEQLKENMSFLYAPPAARVYSVASISVSSNNSLALPFDNERYDTDNIHDTGTNPSRLTCQSPGKYLIIGQAAFESNTTSYRRLKVRLNGATIIAQETVAPVNGAATEMTVATIYELAANDYVELLAYQNSGGALAINTLLNYTPEFSMIRIG
jgi:hypothetical protein